MRVLVVEDDALVGDAIQRALSGAGFAVDLMCSAEAARAALAADAFDMLVLDIGLPRESGLQLMGSLRARGTLLPILMLTARDGVDDRVGALNLGADDYLVKPFEITELVARCRALIRRANAATAQMSIGPMKIDMTRKEVQVDGVKLELTHREWSILECLVLNLGHIVSKDRLMSAVASFAEDLTPNAIEVYVSRLRAKLGRGVSLRAVRGMGYTLAAMAERDVPTIRGRLLGLLLLPALLVLTAGLVIDYFVALGPIEDSYDQALTEEALAVAAHLSSDAQGLPVLLLPPDAVSILRADSNDQIYYRVASGDRFIAGDEGLPQAAGGRNPSRASAQFRGVPIRMVTYRLERAGVPVEVTIAETRNKREKARARTVTRALAVDVAQLAIAFAILWFGSRGALRPLERVREEISQRSASTLEPIPLDPVPREIRRVIEELNRLFATVQASSLAQRRFLESAAHQLRTPLAGIQAQLELLVLDESDGARRDRLARILEGARLLSHTTLQLLTLARSDEAANLRWKLEPVPLDELVTSIVADRLTAADAAGVDLGAQLQPAVIQGVNWLLREALGNLVNNAIAHTPAGGSVTVACGQDAQAAFLEVADSGVGIPADERQRVLERFYRASNALGRGSGLGLAIVQEVAQLHGATLVIGDAPHGTGTLVRLVFDGAAARLAVP